MKPSDVWCVVIAIAIWMTMCGLYLLFGRIGALVLPATMLAVVLYLFASGK